MILLITNKNDVTTDLIVNKLNNLHHPYYRLNTEDLFHFSGTTIELSNNIISCMIKDYFKDHELDLTRITAVYFRRPGTPNVRNDSLTIGEQNLVQIESQYALEGIYKVLDSKLWVSPIYSIREAENKIYQLLIAQELGFHIPDSMITTSQKDAIEFMEKYRSGCVIKPIKSGRVDDGPHHKLIYTSFLGDEHINYLDGISGCPSYFQEKIDKRADIRATIVGNNVFAAILHSQENDESMIDWRKAGDRGIRMERYELPANITELCINLVKRLNLKFGAIDLALDLNGGYVFFEINPNGQWGWIEKALEYNISGALIRLLLGEEPIDGMA